MGKKKRARAAPPKKASRSKSFSCPVCHTLDSVGSEKVSKEGVFVLTCRTCRKRYTYKYGMLDTPNEAHKSWGDFIYKAKKYGVPCPGSVEGCKCDFEGIAIIEFSPERDETTGIVSLHATLTCEKCGTFIRPLYSNETKSEFKKRMAQENARGREERKRKDNTDKYDDGLVSPEAGARAGSYNSTDFRKQSKKGDNYSRREDSTGSDILDDNQELGSQMSEPVSEDDI